MGGRKRRKLDGDPLARYCQCGHTRAMHGKHACCVCDCPLYRGARAIHWTRILGFNFAQAAHPWWWVLGINLRAVGYATHSANLVAASARSAGSQPVIR